jgi:pyruvate formate lyase activating enzyme
MQYYRYENEDSIICLLCRHYCKLKAGKTAICGINKNIDNKLINLVHSHPSSLNIDPIEKKPLYHFIPTTTSFSIGTVGCNFRCPFCQNHSISQTSKVNENINYSPKDIVNLALKHQTKSISYTYNEPTIWYPYAKDIGILAKKEGLKNVFVTSGYESIEVLEDMKSFIDATNVDLKSFSKKYYKDVLKTSLNGVLDSLKKISDSDIHLEVTTLVIPDVNDSNEEIRDMAKFIAHELGKECVWHLSAFHPNYKMNNNTPTSLSILKRAKEIALEEGLIYVYIGNVKNDNSTYCPNCNSLLIKREFYNTQIVFLDTKTRRCKKCSTIIKGIWR